MAKGDGFILIKGISMNILMIGELYRYGGASEIMEVIARNLRNRGHKVVLVYGYNYKKQKIQEGTYILFENKYIRTIHNRIEPLIERFDMSNFYTKKYIENIIKKENIHIINLHAAQGGYISIKDIAYFSKRYNIIWTIHDTWALTGGCMYYSDCHKWIQGNCFDCKEDAIYLRYKNPYKHYKRKKKKLIGKNILYVAPSQWMLHNIKQSFLKKETAICIENGINLNYFVPLKNKVELKNKHEISQDKYILMFIAGNIENKYKGWNCLIEALKRIKNHEQYELLAVGEMNDDLERLPLETKAMGFIEEKMVLNELYNIADVFIIPSIQDNFPTVTLEAQAAGVPVIAFPTGGIKEQVTNETGWVLSEISPIELAETIDKIFIDTNVREVLNEKGNKARKRCEELYNENVMCEKYEKIYLGNMKNEKIK